MPNLETLPPEVVPLHCLKNDNVDVNFSPFTFHFSLLTFHFKHYASTLQDLQEHEHGVEEKEITVNPPSISDLEAREWGDNQKNFRYIVTTTITVATNKVTEVNKAIFKQAELLKQGVAIENSNAEYEYASFQQMKPEMMAEAIKNAQKTAEQFAEASKSELGQIQTAGQGQFEIEDRDQNTPYIKKLRVVTTITYSLKD